MEYYLNSENLFQASPGFGKLRKLSSGELGGLANQGNYEIRKIGFRRAEGLGKLGNVGNLRWGERGV